ncbi:MAG: YgiT-type zinc finger protein [Bacteroidetes bacterium]|nr:MAG: YgiT-type zinc finger protein [Bacteroidota bacterium]
MKVKYNNCGNNTFHDEIVNHVLEIKARIYAVKNIPAKICDRCEAKFFSPETYDAVYKMNYNPKSPNKKIEAELLEFS